MSELGEMKQCNMCEADQGDDIMGGVAAATMYPGEGSKEVRM